MPCYGSPFTLEEKQILLEAKNLDIRKNKIAEILTTILLINIIILLFNKLNLQSMYQQIF